MSSVVKLTTVQEWIRKYDPEKKWIQYEVYDERPTLVQRIKCGLCIKHESKINIMRNFSRAFIDGITGKSVKADTIRKHGFCEPHVKSKALERNAFEKQLPNHHTPPTSSINNLFAASQKQERERVSKLIDLAYALASEEIAFAKFVTFASLEKRHGVAIGNTYLNQIKCQEFTNIIGEDLKNQLISEIEQCDYFSVLMDGATDVSATEKEVIYLLFINSKGERQTRFLRLKNAKNATAIGIKDCLMEAFQQMGLKDVDKKIIGFMADGASVNLGIRRGVAALLKEDFDWLIVIHCLNHRLELAAKDAFSDTQFLDIITMLNNLHSLYQHSPKKIRELQELGEIMNETVTKPEKAMGTRWLQHKRSACQSLIKSYPVIINHLENIIEDSTNNVKQVDKAKYKGYLTKLKSFNFVLYLLYFLKVLIPLAKLSLTLQGDSIDLLYAISCLETFYTVIHHEDCYDDTSELGCLIQNANCDSFIFKGVELNMRCTSLESFKKHTKTFKTKIESCVKNRFSDLKENDVFKVLTLINTSMWPTQKKELDKFGNNEIQVFISHFRTILEKNNVEIESILFEWMDLKNFWVKYHSSLKSREFLHAVLTTYSNKFSNMKHIILILMVYPVSNAKLERAFSAMARIKCDWRNKLAEDTLENLLRIQLEGPPPELFDSSKCVDIFFSTNRRPNVQPYGPRTPRPREGLESISE